MTPPPPSSAPASVERSVAARRPETPIRAAGTNPGRLPLSTVDDDGNIELHVVYPDIDYRLLDCTGGDDCPAAVHALLCHCPGPHTRDPDCPQQCRRCLRRIHRRHDYQLSPPG